jgi:N-acetylmuramoyl-L-alanine amidase
MGNIVLKKYPLLYLAIAFFVTIFCFQVSVLADNSINKSSKNQIIQLYVTNQNNIVELKFRLNNTIKYKVFTLTNPNRLVVDFDNTTLSDNIDAITHPLILSTRTNIDRKNRLRIVFDLKNSIKIKKSQLTKLSKNKYDLIFGLVYENTNLLPTSYIIKSNDPIYKLLNGKNNEIKYTTNKIRALPVIVIDAGHGGKDPGTTGKYIRSKEKYITLGYAIELKKQLDKTKKFEVFLTRSKDYFIPLKKRVDIARRKKADLFVSLHANASPDKNVFGLSIYTLSETSSDKQASDLASKENKSDIIGGANFSDTSGDIIKTLINLSQRSTMNESAKFAEIIIKSANKYGINTIQKTHRFAGFRVLTAPDMPSALIELGYLSNKNEEIKLNSSSYKKKVSSSLVSAIKEYFDY